MKIILSRKGFDSSPQYGGIPSPILPDGTLLSLPLPASTSHSLVKNSDLEDVHGHSAAKLIEDLTKGKITPSMRTHFDPDLRRCMLSRDSGWRPLFGPACRSHSHMANHGVKVGDLILFFGWFRKVYLDNGTYRFVQTEPHLHVLFGWLQIDEMLPAGLKNRKNAPEWAQYHPHFQNDWGSANHVYVSRKQLSIPRLIKKLPGGGAFETYSDVLCLTAPDCSRSIWRLPRSIYPKRGRSLLTYHCDEKLWIRTANHTILHTQAKGQEFVLHSDEYPEAITWARRILTHAA
jgi:hypothetical protein